MSRRGVVFTPEAEEQIAELYRYIEENACAEVALGYPTAVVEYCEGLKTFPDRTNSRSRDRRSLFVRNLAWSWNAG